MRKPAVLLAVIGLMTAGPALAQEAPPYWAFPVPSHAWPPPDPAQTAHLPGSGASFTLAQLDDRFAAPDWYPRDHPAMPSIVATGRKPQVFACGSCHLPNGRGGPDNASLAGQPVGYILDQLRAMREGLRKSSSDRMGGVKAMLAVAQTASDPEVRAAAEYFHKLKMTRWIRVVETDRVPRTDIDQANMLVVVPGQREPIGKRIIEVPQNPQRTRLRDSRSGFIAYVPRGAVARGRKLVAAGAGGFPCAACHGKTLRGDANVPGLAGRSPSYLVRQLYDFKHGSRNGPAAQMMAAEISNMSDDMRLDIAAYLASLAP